MRTSCARMSNCFLATGLLREKIFFGRREKEPVRKGDRQSFVKTSNFVFKDDVSKDEQGLNVKPLFTLQRI